MIEKQAQKEILVGTEMKTLFLSPGAYKTYM